MHIPSGSFSRFACTPASRAAGLTALIAMGVFTIACDKGAAEVTATNVPVASTAAANESAMTLDGKDSRKKPAGPVARGGGALAANHAAASASAWNAYAPKESQATAPPAATMTAETLAPHGDPRDESGHRATVAQRLDPNARYATTYRPGGAALAAFDAALSRGSIPDVYKDLVGDFGSRYAPAIEKPAHGAMAFKVETERTSVAPGGGPLNLRIAMRSTDAMPARAQLSVHLVLDISGSMQGVAIANAKKAAETLVEKLAPNDDFSMVTFSNDADVIVPDGPIGPRKQLVLAKIHDVQAQGGTNISAGLDLGYAQAHARTIPEDAVKIVMLLSDGHANAGDTSPVGLAERSAKAFQDGIQTSSFGLGSDFDAPLMSSFADRGAGGYYYLADSSQIAPALTRELEARLIPAAQAVEVRVRLRPDVGATKVFGSRQLNAVEAAQVRAQEVADDKLTEKQTGIKQDRKNDAEGGMRFFMPAFARDDHHAMILTLALPAGTGERSIASVEIRYKDRIAKKNLTEEIPVKITYAGSDAESAATWNASVRATVQAVAAGDAIMAAADLIDRGDRQAAAKLLNERAEILKQASATLNQSSFVEDGLRLARLSGAVLGTGQVQDPVPLALMLRGSSYGYLR